MTLRITDRLMKGVMSGSVRWRVRAQAFRPRSNQTSYAKRTEERKALAAVKAKEKEMTDEKEAERQVCEE